jgi:hypothetical protein
MVFDNILKLQKQLTDKYVVVDDRRPELKRFSGLTGTVKTVNFSGRALVQFDGHNNIGWYDIDPAFLKVIDEPLAKPEKAEKKKEAAPKAEKPAAAAAPAKPAGKSAADILAAARTGAKPAAPAAPKAEAPAKPAGKMSAADILAAAKGGAKATPAAEKPVETKAAPIPGPSAPAKTTPKKLSPAEILAMAKGGAAPGVTPPAPPAAPKATVNPPVTKSAPAPVPEPEPEPPAAAAPSGGAVKSMAGKFKTMDEIIAYLRK